MSSKPQPTQSIWTKSSLWKSLSKSREHRAKFVDTQLRHWIAFQIRALRNREKLSQPQLADLMETAQNQIYLLENPHKTRPTIKTLNKLAELFDVALVVRFVPFSQLVDWVSGTPFVDKGLSSRALNVESFAKENESGGARATRREIVFYVDENVITPLSAISPPKLLSIPQKKTPARAAVVQSDLRFTVPNIVPKKVAIVGGNSQ